jgi:hypothetical protein
MLDFYENRSTTAFTLLSERTNYKPNEPDLFVCSCSGGGRAEKFTFSAEKYEEFLRVSNKNDIDRRARIKGLIRFLRVLGQTAHCIHRTAATVVRFVFNLEGDRSDRSDKRKWFQTA